MWINLKTGDPNSGVFLGCWLDFLCMMKKGEGNKENCFGGVGKNRKKRRKRAEYG